MPLIGLSASSSSDSANESSALKLGGLNFFLMGFDGVTAELDDFLLDFSGMTGADDFLILIGVLLLVVMGFLTDFSLTTVLVLCGRGFA